jgi:predicted  nucleic acid-binding Zn-ribbon protein
MIIEGFEIENWACIKKLVVSSLPATGVIVLHGRNRTGKSSLVKALRFCLMDYPANSNAAALKSCFPSGSGEKPIISVTFNARGATYRVKKCFGTNKSELASPTSTGNWKVETNTSADVHSCVCGLTGGDDSHKGVHQLLWLTQAEFRLPDAKKFDAGVQAQLRGILGVLQTSLDDCFMQRVKKRWNTWYSGQRKVGKRHEIKDGCKLAEKLTKLEETQEELKKSEGKFYEVEGLLRQAAELELEKLDLDRQLKEQTKELAKLQEESQRSQTRIAARRLADERHTSAAKEQEAALEEKRGRTEAANRLNEAAGELGPAKKNVESLVQSVHFNEKRQAQRRENLKALRDNRRGLELCAKRVDAKLVALDDAEKLKLEQQALDRAQGIAQAIDEIKKYLRENPAPEKKELDALKTNRQKVLQLQAERDAASLSLKLAPMVGVAPAQLTVDGAPLQPAQDSPTPQTYSVRSKAELVIPTWGRVELSRGTSKRDINEIENELRQCDEEFANAVASFGIVSSDADAFEQLLRRSAEHELKNAELKRQEGEFRKFAPKGLEPFQRKVLELETKLKGAVPAKGEGAEPFPADANQLKALKADFDNQVVSLDTQITSSEGDIETAETDLGQERINVMAAKEELAGFEATASTRKEELSRLRTEAEMGQRIEDAQRDLKTTQIELTQTELTNEESTINERLAACKEAVSAIERQIRENEEKYNRIKGRLEGSEGLHAQRALLSTRVDELTRFTQRESLEKDAVDRLYELFEECREKKLGTLMAPVHDRVLNWMRVLDIGDYKEVKFSDAFLPDKLVRRDDTAEFTIDEESTGAQEQIGMLVRLALGSLLTSAEEPTVAILDDPLTHCDFGRLNIMRAILRRAAEGDAKLNPPAGALQIIILTCHPEWFRDERATVIDLENPGVMERFSV